MMVSAYRILDTESNFILLFKHRLESKGLNSLVSITRYRQRKLFREKVNSYFQNLIQKIYTTASEEQQQNYAETIKNLLEEVKTCKNQHLAQSGDYHHHHLVQLHQRRQDPHRLGEAQVDQEAHPRGIISHSSEELEELCD